MATSTELVRNQARSILESMGFTPTEDASYMVAREITRDQERAMTRDVSLELHVDYQFIQQNPTSKEKIKPKIPDDKHPTYEMTLSNPFGFLPTTVDFKDIPKENAGDLNLVYLREVPVSEKLIRDYVAGGTDLEYSKIIEKK